MIRLVALGYLRDICVGQQTVFVSLINFNLSVLGAVNPHFRAVGEADRVFTQLVLFDSICQIDLGKNDITADDTVITPADIVRIGVSQKRIKCPFFCYFGSV